MLQFPCVLILGIKLLIVIRRTIGYYVLILGIKLLIVIHRTIGYCVLILGIKRLIVIRRTIGIPENNDFLFARFKRNSLNAIRGWDAIPNVARKMS